VANILILSLVFPPDNVSTAHIMGDLASDLRDRGHSVTVLTTTPHYNRDEEEELRQPRRPVWGPLLATSSYQGIRVFHTMMPRKGSNVALRLIAWLSFHALSTFAGITVLPKPDVIIAPSPPLTVGLSAWIIGAVRGSRFVYNVQEIYPDIAIRLGALRNRTAISLLYRLERFVYQKAARISVISPSMRANLIMKDVPDGKVRIIPNFVDLADFRPMEKHNTFSRAYGVQDKFVVSYAGNMGVPQGLETFLDAAFLLKERGELAFMMIGEGMKTEVLRKRAAALGLRNLIFLPHQPYSLVPQIYATSDANIVPQTSEAGFDAIPSKVYRIMASGRPVIAVTESTSDLAKLVLEAECGIVVRPGSSRDLADAILQASEDKEEWEKLGVAGRDHVQRHYSRKAITDRYDHLIGELTSS
jgi:colanic acid biosynthesis glycosyl transferase WcaI